MKLKTLILQSVMAFMAVLTCFPIQAVNTITYTATYNGIMTFGTDTLGGVTYRTVHYDGLFNDGAPGMPSLPVDYIRFSVPWNATNFTVTTSLGNSTDYSYKYLVYPCQPPRMMSDTTPLTVTLPDMTAYVNYPQQNAWVVDEGFLAGENHIVTVAVMPVSYVLGDPDNGFPLFKKWSTIQLTLSFQLNDSPAITPLTRSDAAMRQEGFTLTRGMVVNPENVESNAPVSQNRTLTGDYPYVIVTTDTLCHPLRRLAALKRQKGYNVQVVTMSDVLSSPYSGQGDVVNNVLTDTTNAGKLRQYLKYCYNDLGTKFVLLAGDEIPYKTITTSVSTSAPSDVYYTDLNSDWSYNNDIKTKDFFPELYVGRILPNNGQQVSNYTDKLFRYELNPGNGDYGYLKKILYSESYDLWYNSEVSNISQYFNNIYPNSDRIYLYESASLSRYPSGKLIIDTLNVSPCGFISMSDHAGPSGFIISGYGTSNDYINDDVRYYLWAIDTIHIVYGGQIYNADPHTGNGLNNLNNRLRPNICFSTGCTTMPFDKAPGYETVPITLGNSFTLGKDYGGPAFLGDTRQGYIGLSSNIERYFAVNLMNQYYKIGMAEAHSRKSVSSNNQHQSYHVNVTHNLLGEPEFEIWTDIPQQYSNITVARSDNSVTVNGIDGNSTIVAYYANDGQIGTTTVSTSSATLNGISPNSTIMLYKHNRIPYIVPLELQNVTLANDQYVIAGDVTAGSNVDSDRTSGDVIVPSGVEYEIEASGTVTLQGGFKVEKGATFAVYPSSF